jgi:hypothetical protein
MSSGVSQAQGPSATQKCRKRHRRPRLVPDLRRIEGALLRYNRKSVTVVSDDGQRTTVLPGFLEKAEANAQ